ncbi:MAG: TonB-dependent receptor [Gemmatimonadales bacterium]
MSHEDARGVTADRRCRYHVAAWIVAVLIALVPSAARAQTGTVAGQVTDADGNRLAFAEIQWEGASAWIAANADGDFLLEVPAGTRTILARSFGHRTAQQVVDVPAGGSVRVSFDLETRPIDVPGVSVSVLRPDLVPQATLETREVRESNPRDAGELLRSVEGVNAVRRGPLGLDPVVRGLRETEVGTYLDGTRLFPAGPARMDSPLTHLDPSAVRNIEVIKGPYALTWGAGNLSAIRVETQSIPEVESRPHGSVSAGYDSNLRAAETSASLYGRPGRWAYTLDGAWRTGDDYEAGNGQIVPGDFESWEGRGKLAFDVGEGGQLVLGGGYQEQGPIDYPGRLLRAESFEAPTVNAAFEWSGDGTLRSLEARAYRNRVDHTMTNIGKPTAMDMPGRTPPFAIDVFVDSKITVTGGRLAGDLVLGGPWTAEVGVDAYSANRDATRTISRQSTGMTMFEDRMWPDATITDIGGFSRLGWREGRLSISGTARLDAVSADAPSAVVSQFFLDNNPSGANLDATETNLSGAITTSLNVTSNWTFALGVGTAVRTADASERYSDRVPASKAQFAAEFMGDPQLDPERSTQGDLWVDGRYTDLRLHLGAFARRVDDYVTIAPTSLPTRLPLSPPTVFQYVNGEATFYGVDGSLSLGVTDRVTVTTSGSYLYGQDETLDEPAIGVAPVTGSLGLRYEEGQGRFYIEGIGTAVARQDRVSASRNEAPTPGYQLLDVRGGIGVGNGVTLRAGVLNVFDEFYWNHLNARNPFTTQPVPEPGRVAFVDLSWAF